MKPRKSIEVEGTNIWITKAFIFILCYFSVHVKQMYLRNVFLVNDLCFWYFTCKSEDTAAVRTVEFLSFLVAV